jgi:cold shock protein
MKGTVKFFNVEKGFGFIADTNGKEYFVHISGLIDEIKENDEVTFETSEGRKGENAVEVRLVSSEFEARKAAGWKQVQMNDNLLVLDPEDWSEQEWTTVCKLMGVSSATTIRVNLENLEYFQSND